MAFHEWRLAHAGLTGSAELEQEGKKSEAVPLLGFFEQYKIERYCCRRIFLSLPEPSPLFDDTFTPSTVAITSVHTDNAQKVLPHRFYVAR